MSAIAVHDVEVHLGVVEEDSRYLRLAVLETVHERCVPLPVLDVPVYPASCFFLFFYSGMKRSEQTLHSQNSIT